jgi:hypothetical protein
MSILKMFATGPPFYSLAGKIETIKIQPNSLKGLNHAD